MSYAAVAQLVEHRPFKASVARPIRARLYLMCPRRLGQSPPFKVVARKPIRRMPYLKQKILWSGGKYGSTISAQDHSKNYLLNLISDKKMAREKMIVPFEEKQVKTE